MADWKRTIRWWNGSKRNDRLRMGPRSAIRRPLQANQDQLQLLPGIRNSRLQDRALQVLRHLQDHRHVQLVHPRLYNSKSNRRSQQPPIAPHQRRRTPLLVPIREFQSYIYFVTYLQCNECLCVLLLGGLAQEACRIRPLRVPLHRGVYEQSWRAKGTSCQCYQNSISMDSLQVIWIIFNQPYLKSYIFFI